MEYEIQEQIHEGLKTIVYRARRQDDQTPVIIKELRGLYPSMDKVAQFRREHDLLRTASGPGVIQALACTQFEGVVRLLIEDFGAISVDAYLGAERLSLVEVLELGITVAHTLHRIHALGIAHLDVTPGNIVRRPEDGTVKLIDFGISSMVEREEIDPQMHLTKGFAGTPLYMSPEQTGRMNRPLDHRSDLYTLGATLFHLLCGHPPFESMDRLALVHAHIARTPTALHKIDAEIPASLSDIIARLLSKCAEDRYQTGCALAEDLSRCLAQVEAGNLTPFSLNLRAHMQHLSIPDKLYGRAPQVKLLEGSFACAAEGATTCLLVSGAPGIGKTALISEVHRSLARGKGHFLRGKAQQFQRATPYGALLQAVEGFVQSVLAQSSEVLALWQAQLSAVVGTNGRVLTELMPGLVHLLGEQPALAEVTPAEAENRLHELMRRFVRALAGADHPLVLFLDDLQWADLPLLQLVGELVLDPDTTHLLLLGAYRDNEVDAAHPLFATIERIHQQGSLVQTLELAPLQPEELFAMLVDTFGRSEEDVTALAALVHHKTGGNPFFTRRFLHRLAKDGLLALQEGRWHWQQETIERAGFTENVVSFMTESLGALPTPCREALEVAAHIGGQFTLSMLAEVLGQTRHATQLQLAPALSQALIQPLVQGYWVASNIDRETPSKDHETPDFGFRFAHDRIAQAALLSLAQAKVPQLRLALGRSMLSRYQRGNASPFAVVEQLNQAIALIETEQEQAGLAELNAEAGRRALQSAAYETAHHYYSTAVSLTKPSAWEEHYEATLSRFVEASLAAQLHGDIQAMEALVSQVKTHSHSVLDKMRAEEIRIQAFVAQNKYREGVLAALDSLEELGITLPREPSEADVEAGLTAALAALGERTLGDLLALPGLQDPGASASRKVLVNISSAAYLSTPHLLPLIGATLVRNSIKDGVSKESPYGFVVFGLVLCAINMIEQGYLMGEVAVGLLERWPDKGLATRVKHVFNTHVRVFKDPLPRAVESMNEIFQQGLAHGDLEYACWAAHNHCITAFYSGLPLHEVETLMARYTPAMQRYQQLAVLGCNLPFVQLVQNLLGNAQVPHELCGPEYNDAEVLAELQVAGFRGAIFLQATCRVLLKTLLGRMKEAADIALEFDEYQNGATATLHIPTFYFFEALALIALPLDDARSARFQSNLEKLRLWASFAPNNQAHRVALLEAEWYRVHEESIAAMKSYDQSIALAQAHGMAGEEPIAHERAGRFHLAAGRQTVGRAYLREALYQWEQWGAASIVAHLRSEFPHLLSATRTQFLAQTVEAATITTSTEAAGEELDVEALLQASQTLSREVRLPILLEEIMRLAIQNAGATRGYLLMAVDGRLLVQTSKDAEGNIVVPPGTPARECDGLPQSIVQYVARTSGRLVLQDARKDLRFQADPSLQQAGALSVLCAPISHQGHQRAIVYLENHLTSDAFTYTRARIIELLGAQAAISIENARHYTQLEEKVVERTQALQETLTELQETHTQLESQHVQLKETQSQLVQSEKMASLGTLVAGMAHELNNPASFALAGSANLSRHIDNLQAFILALAGEDTEPELLQALEAKFNPLTENLGAITEGIERINSIVSRLRAFSRLEEAAFKEADAIEGLKATLALIEANYHERIRFELHLNSAPLIMCWPAQLNQAFMNIALNACQAISLRAIQGNTQGELQVLSEQRDDTLIISFVDDGIGMSPEVQERIFEPFFTTQEVGKGTGLGLSIAFGIINQHKGRIEVDSTPDSGTRVRLFLPITKAHAT